MYIGAGTHMGACGMGESSENVRNPTPGYRAAVSSSNIFESGH